MKTIVSLVALAVAVAALGVAAFPASTDPAPIRSSDARLDILEDRVALLAGAVEELNTRRRTECAAEAGSRQEAGPDCAGSEQDPDADVQAMVDEAVAKKAREVVSDLEIKRNRKPSIDVLASTLKLSDDQRRAIEAEVSRGQREAYAILSTPTASGRNLMDDLVEIAARGVAWPDRDSGFGQWIMRVLTEKVPGGEQSYGAAIEAVKTSVLSNFRRTLTAEQYAEYRKWGVDPIEVQDIPGSPGEELEQRYRERARRLSQQYPDGPPQ